MELKSSPFYAVFCGCYNFRNFSATGPLQERDVWFKMNSYLCKKWQVRLDNEVYPLKLFCTSKYILEMFGRFVIQLVLHKKNLDKKNILHYVYNSWKKIYKFICLEFFHNFSGCMPILLCGTLKPGYNAPRYSEFRDIVNKTQLPFWGFTKHITFDIVNHSIIDIVN